ncbi:unnamed protein product, partial [Pylaiella littoralis]
KSWPFSKEEKIAIFKIISDKLGAQIHSKEFAFSRQHGFNTWHTRVGVPVMQLLKKNPAYMAEHGHDYKERFAPSEMRHLRNWWKEQKKADGKLRQKAGTGGSGGKPLEKLSHFQTLRRDCFQSNDACNRRDLMKETFNLSAAGGS